MGDPGPKGPNGEPGIGLSEIEINSYQLIIGVNSLGTSLMLGLLM